MVHFSLLQLRLEILRWTGPEHKIIRRTQVKVNGDRVGLRRQDETIPNHLSTNNGLRDHIAEVATRCQGRDTSVVTLQMINCLCSLKRDAPTTKERGPQHLSLELGKINEPVSMVIEQVLKEMSGIGVDHKIHTSPPPQVTTTSRPPG